LKDHQVKSEYQKIMSRSHTVIQSSTQPKESLGLTIERCQKLQQIAPTYLSWDVNLNDIWNKRRQSLRKFIALVSKWIIRNRMRKIKDKLVEFFVKNNLFTREAVKAYVDQDNKVKKNASTTVPRFEASEKIYRSHTNDSVDALLKPDSLSQLLFGAMPSNSMMKSEDLLMTSMSSPTSATKASAFSPSSASTSDDSALRSIIDRHLESIEKKKNSSSLTKEVSLPHEQGLKAGATESSSMQPNQPSAASPPVNLMLPPLDMWQPRTLADDQSTTSRIGAGSLLSLEDLLGKKPSVDPASSFVDCSYSPPSWMMPESSASSSIHDQEYTPFHPDYRFYLPEPMRCEMDDDWCLRPRSFTYEPRPCLRSSWIQSGCFLATNTYLLDEAEARCFDPNDPEMLQPKSSSLLSYSYQPELDRHISGLICFADDHRQGLFDRDYHVKDKIHAKQSDPEKSSYLLSKADPSDVLSDSESDDDELYPHILPSAERVEMVLRTELEQLSIDPPSQQPPAKSRNAAASPSKNSKKAAPAAAAKKAKTSTTNGKDKASKGSPKATASGALSISQEDRVGVPLDELSEVALMLERDSKRMEFESNRLARRHERIDEVSQRLCQVAESVPCAAIAPIVQLPFHQQS
jgi:hypothetical protein